VHFAARHHPTAAIVRRPLRPQLSAKITYRSLTFGTVASCHERESRKSFVGAA